MRILLIDDSVWDRRMIRRLVKRCPLEISLEEVFDLEAACQAIDVENFDCLLVDYHLPDGTGVDFVRNLVARMPSGLPPIVMMTSLPSDQIAEAAMAAGVSEFLAKDELNPKAFDRMLKNALLRQGGATISLAAAASQPALPSLEVAREAFTLLQHCPEVMAAIAADSAAMTAWHRLNAFLIEAPAVINGASGPNLATASYR
jgi:CheY-like chemotaxis protein